MFLELRDAHKGVAGLDQLGFDTLYLDDRAGYADDQRLGLVFAHDGERDLAARLAAHTFDRVIQGDAFHQRVVQLDDQVTALYARLKCGRVFYRRNDFDQTVFHADFYSQAAEFTLRA